MVNLNDRHTPDEQSSGLSPGFKFRLIMTMVFLILAVVYILWLIKLL
ncbi:MAG: hypothetical protein L0Y79_00715 [Chlorobi bacterium]|nr:hypothetical protein [Chlorobiota bacterium]MCI0715482.1 hypothetical protein [Chlorobiota bacterium]